ncbi:hypothetical protein [Motiliproteus sp. MSK22-1]|uniref:hypothetical protein n=1 Tax=Motiliproteus sp. MSK22-1 TaxID=1897630 RepID=UPI0009789F82|nr:hypothetical protein [Motiliproteus sp. MSK22-1]OMH25608.1 hypothetical protein BGP75_23970 [Motiliproteus sp. MSK22-1]
MKHLVVLACHLALVVGCQAQAVNPEQPAPSVGAQQFDSSGLVLKRFDEMDKSNARVEQRITLVQEQVIKLNQQMQGLHQRNLQLLQALQQMQLSMTQLTAGSKSAQSSMPAELSSSDGTLKPDEQALSSATKLEALISRLEQFAADQEAGGSTGKSKVTEEFKLSSTELDAGGFRLVSAYTPKGQWVIFKYDEQTGLTWNAQDGGWMEVGELEPLPASVYQVVLRPASGDVKGYVAARIDRETGRSWWLRGNVWESFE